MSHVKEQLEKVNSLIQPSIPDLKIVNENLLELTTELGASKQVQAMELSSTPSGHGKMEVPQGLTQRSESAVHDELVHMTDQIDDSTIPQLKEFAFELYHLRRPASSNSK